jgi:peroxiredoxin family protein/TusA-related sulfurtransferase
MTAAPLVVDCRGLQCPAPIMRVADTARQLAATPRAFEVLASDPDFLVDLEAWCRATNAKLVSHQREAEGVTRAVVAMKGASALVVSAGSGPLDVRGQPAPFAMRAVSQALASARAVSVRLDGDGQVDALERWVASIGAHVTVSRRPSGVEAHVSLETPAASPATTSPVRTTLLLLRNDIESLMAALMVANASAATGARVEVFFSFWAVTLLRTRKPRTTKPGTPAKRTLLDRLFGWMLPVGPSELRLSQLHMGGLGRWLLFLSMKRKQILGLEQLLDSAVTQGVTFSVCSMSMGLCGVRQEELRELPNLRFAGVAAFAEAASKSTSSLVF